jgi:hypothetical protein
MVSHQDIGVEPPPEAPDRTRKNLEEEAPVVVISENRPTLVPAARNVPQGSGMLQAQWPSHH